MTHFKFLPSVGILTATAIFSFVSSADAADRLLDFSGGCKVYKLENRAWVETDASAMEGMGVANNQILKDEKFTVFRTTAGTFGVNQKCVKAGDGTLPTPVQQRRARTTARTKRVSAAKASEPSYFDSRKGEWSAAFGIGMNLSPSGTLLDSRDATSTSVSFGTSIAFMGEAIYRMHKYFRVSGLLGITQLKDNAGGGNETSFFALRPEVPLRVSPNIELYFGPMLGFYFLSQNAETRETAGITIKQQTASSLLLGGILGADYAINEQFDIGAFLLYFKPGDLKVTATTTATGTEFSSTLSTSYMTLGTRFVIHF
jgi:hypothetical protein